MIIFLQNPASGKKRRIKYEDIVCHQNVTIKFS